MARYLLDTSVLIDFSKGREPARSRILQMIDDGDELGVCAVNVAEFYAGLPEGLRPIWDEFFGALRYWDISREAASRAGCIRFESAREGRPLTTTDTLIAAVAEEVDAVIATGNVKDYPTVSATGLLPL